MSGRLWSKRKIASKKRAFLAEFERTGHLANSLAKADYAYDTHRRWKSIDAEYATAFEGLADAVGMMLEREAIRRAVEGVDKPVWHKGVQVGTVREYSDQLLTLLLKGNMPDRYRDRFDANLTGKVDLSVSLVRGILDGAAAPDSDAAPADQPAAAGTGEV